MSYGLNENESHTVSHTVKALTEALFTAESVSAAGIVEVRKELIEAIREQLKVLRPQAKTED